MPKKYSDFEKNLKRFVKNNYGITMSDFLCKCVCHFQKLDQLRKDDVIRLYEEFKPIHDRISHILDGPNELGTLGIFDLFLSSKIDYYKRKNIISEKSSYDFSKYVGKFFIKQYAEFQQDCILNIIGNMYTKELTVQLLGCVYGTVLETYGYKLSDMRINDMKQFLNWQSYEKIRDIDEWEMPHRRGYRDGWGYKICCMNESGKPPVFIRASLIFDKNHSPCYSKLLDYLVDFLSQKDELKRKNILW